MNKFLSISDLSRKLNLIDPSTKKPQNHVLRYWEKEFKNIKPKKINNRRYYSEEQIQRVKTIKFLLKDKGMSISGVKKLINSKINKLDGYNNHGLKPVYYNKLLKLKSKKILEKIKVIKNYGKKNLS